MNTTRISKKRAVSTIIGSFFFIIIMVAAFTAFVAMLNTNNEFFRTQLDVSQQEISKSREKFVVSACTDSGNSNRLKVFVENDGVVPVEITDLFIINKDTHYTNRYDITFDDSFVAIGQKNNILESQTITMSSTPYTYDIKVVSALGHSETISLPVANPSTPDPRLNVTAFAIPPEITNGGNVTIVMIARNVGNHTLYDVRPSGDFSILQSNVNANRTHLGPQHTPRLDPNEEMIFRWQYDVFGGVGTKVQFSNTVKAKLCEQTSTYDVLSKTEIVKSKIVTDFEIQAVGPDEPFARPKFYLAHPGPFVESNSDKGYFAVVVANPTNQTMTVYRISFQLMVPENDQIFSAVTAGTNPGVGTWSNPQQNVAEWVYTTGVNIPGRGVESWEASLTSDTASKDAPANVIAANIFTNFGQFGNTEKTSAIENDGTSAIVNLYQSTSSSGSDRIYHIEGITGGTAKTFYITIESSGHSSSRIDSGATLIITIPAGFTNLGSFSVSGSLNTPNTSNTYVKTFDDGSKQIRVTTSANIAGGSKATLSFSATPPDLEDTHLYVLHILATGTTDGGKQIIGAGSETVIQVCKSPSGGTCPP
ncbi:MAG: hypothetical protein ACT4OW_01940 [Nitrososphaerota archaeon]